MDMFKHRGPSPFYPDLMSLNQTQINTVVAVERVGASLSLLGVALIVITYWAFKKLRTVPNLFILFASIANAGASIACLIGYDGVEAGMGSALCKTQAFMLEMFMQSDPWWSFAMAVNVYLVFFYGANPASFRKHVWIYCLVCFGIPFVPALVCLLYREDVRGVVYGDATLWCWISNEWTELRIYTYYLPIWVCIFFSTLIYIAVGYHVFKQRNQLRNLTFSSPGNDGKVVICSTSDVRESADKETQQPARSNVYGTAVTEVKVTTFVPRPRTPPPPPSLAPPGRVPRPTRSCENLCNVALYPGHDEESPTGSADSMARPRFEATCTSSPAQELSVSVLPKRTRASSVFSKFRSKFRHLDPVKLAYLRTSFVFAISILVTWTPSSVNRIHSLIHPFTPNYGLNVASAVVLPLQGVWNAVIYFSTSWNTCREELEKTRMVGKIMDLLGRGGQEDRRRWGVSGIGQIDGVEMRTRDRGIEMGTVRVGTVRAMTGSF
ncbi:hypothetical protein jhhlp_007023 [Lomentospora prolificans]|uniref:G-protein coupled receptors family 2 profile 2 domain-containing protein n=1 Tax=Lomentospora prolificans TaxID=41688 RepID=A0A2N3N1H2_9PEZI|nr:hypothetical protein jhhlp_007023 [Lomentospora prolificans]